MKKMTLLLWIAGMPGVLAVSWLALPFLLKDLALPVPATHISAASALQSALLLAIAAWIGSSLAPKTGLGAPLLQSWISGAPVAPLAWRPALLGGLAGALLLLAFSRWAPPQLAELTQRHELPLLARLLYGGITEEILVRWGLMTAILWVIKRIADGSAPVPAPWMAALAILVSAILFGAAHLPVVVALGGPLDGAAALIVILANSVFGIIAGLLFWRHGLEAAIVAHLGAHAIAAALGH